MLIAQYKQNCHPNKYFVILFVADKSIVNVTNNWKDAIRMCTLIDDAWRYAPSSTLDNLSSLVWVIVTIPFFAVWLKNVLEKPSKYFNKAVDK